VKIEPTLAPPETTYRGAYATIGRICASARHLERLLREALQVFIEATGCGAGGMRLSQPDGGLPFYVSHNLDPDFYRTEDLGSVRECICGAVARGGGSEESGFTRFGAFVANGLQEYASGLAVCQILGLRGRCILNGYESVAVVPLRNEGKPLGVIYLADSAPGVFGPQALDFLQASARLLAAAIPRLREVEADPGGPQSGTEAILAALGHDLRTPLVPVKGLLNLVLAGKFGPLAPKQSELLNICQLSIDREIELIDNLLESSRLRSGHLELERAMFDLRNAIRDALVCVTPLAKEEACRVEVDLPKAEVPVRGDRRRLLRVFSNLLSNAIKYGGMGGQARLAAAVEGGHVVVRVADDGPGVAEGERDKVFEWLYRGRQASGKPGSGLGLAIARDIVARHGGTLRVESCQPSVFCLRLPLAPEAEAEQPAGTREEALAL